MMAIITAWKYHVKEKCLLQKYLSECDEFKENKAPPPTTNSRYRSRSK